MPDPINLPQSNVSARGSSGTSGLIASGVQLAGGLFQNYLNHQWSQEAWKKTEQARHDQNAFNASEAQKQREAASLTNYIRQLKSAGINLDILYGQSAPVQGQMSSGQGGSIGSYLPASASNPLAGVIDAYRTGRLMDLEYQKELADLRYKRADADIKQAEANDEYLDEVIPKVQKLEADIKQSSVKHLDALVEQLTSLANKLNEETNNAKKEGQLLDYDVMLQKALLTGEVDDKLKNSKVWRNAQSKLDAEFARLGFEERFPALDLLQIALSLRERYGNIDLNDVENAKPDEESIAYFAQQMAKTMYRITQKQDESFWLDFALSHLTDLLSSSADLIGTISTRGASKLVNETWEEKRTPSGRTTTHTVTRRRAAKNN